MSLNVQGIDKPHAKGFTGYSGTNLRDLNPLGRVFTFVAFRHASRAWFAGQVAVPMPQWDESGEYFWVVRSRRGGDLLIPDSRVKAIERDEYLRLVEAEECVYWPAHGWKAAALQARREHLWRVAGHAWPDPPPPLPSQSQAVAHDFALGVSELARTEHWQGLPAHVQDLRAHTEGDAEFVAEVRAAFPVKYWASKPAPVFVRGGKRAVWA
ncbi:hypothetical protein Q8F55_005982 [Vanrija albida]|uniref:Pyridoxamine 5'-phosphate oxidase Alr4036 family FMN-binding domain-containing protein n=1 Tax=Vanrija albida TaxID=181172 RepID=A0ABR3Q3B9_9TREE